jgi:hypothetical protein
VNTCVTFNTPKGGMPRADYVCRALDNYILHTVEFSLQTVLILCSRKYDWLVFAHVCPHKVLLFQRPSTTPSKTVCETWEYLNQKLNDPIVLAPRQDERVCVYYRTRLRYLIWPMRSLHDPHSALIIHRTFLRQPYRILRTQYVSVNTVTHNTTGQC